MPILCGFSAIKTGISSSKEIPGHKKNLTFLKNS